MGEHARLAPSSAPMWVPCPGSVVMQEQYPEQGHNEAAEVGDAAHHVASVVIQDFIDYGRHGHTFKRSDFLDKPAPNGVLITDEMLDAVEVYVRDVIATSNRFPGDASVMLEYRVHMPMIHPENWGTLDSSISWQDRAGGTLVLSDFKYGYVIVEVWENWQLLDYCAGLLSDLYQRNYPMPEFIEFRIAQPRAHHRDGPVRVWTIRLSELAPYVEKMKASAYEALGPNPRTVPGTHCTYCSGRHACQALLESVYACATVVSSATPMELRGLALGRHLKLLHHVHTLVKAQISGMEEQALAAIQRGEQVPDWEWARGEGRTKWTTEIEKVKALAGLYGVKLVNEVPITPKQAISAGLPETIVNANSASTPGAFKLTPVNTKRVQSIFKQK